MQRFYTKQLTKNLGSTEAKLLKAIDDHVTNAQNLGLVVTMGGLFHHCEKLCNDYSTGRLRKNSIAFKCDMVARHNGEIDEYHATRIDIFCDNKKAVVMEIYDRNTTQP